MIILHFQLMYVVTLYFQILDYFVIVLNENSKKSHSVTRAKNSWSVMIVEENLHFSFRGVQGGSHVRLHFVIAVSHWSVYRKVIINKLEVKIKS